MAQLINARTEDIQVLGQRLRVWRAGEGDPVLLLHGFSHSSAWWKPTVQALRTRYHTICVDLPSFGDSARLAGDLTPEFVEAFVRSLVDALHLSSCAVIGHSMGGMIAIRLAYCRPEVVRWLVLVAPMGVSREVALRPRFAALFPAVTAQVFLHAPRRVVVSSVHRLLYDARRTDPDDMWANLMHRDLHTDGFAEDWAQFLHRGLSLTGQRPEWIAFDQLAKIKAATLIVWGQNDPLLPVNQADVLAGCIPGSEVHIIPRCGHLAQLEHADEFNRLVASFLAARRSPEFPPPRRAGSQPAGR